MLITLTDFRRRPGRLIRLARETGMPVTITDHGEPVADLVPRAPVIPQQRQAPDAESITQ